MVAGCGNKCVKFAMFFFNLMFCACGAAILAISLWIRFDNEFARKYFTDILSKTTSQTINLDNWYIALYVLAAIGGLLFITGFLGCCGAACESTCLLGLFFTIILILFCAELAAGIYIIVKKDDIKSEISKWFKSEVVDQYGKAGKEELTKNIKEIFTNLNCCGAEKGCDDLPSGTQCTDACGADGRNKPGCVGVLWDHIMTNLNIIGGVALAILAFELLGMIFCLILCCAIRQGPYSYA